MTNDTPEFDPLDVPEDLDDYVPEDLVNEAEVNEAQPYPEPEDGVQDPDATEDAS